MGFIDVSAGSAAYTNSGYLLPLCTELDKPPSYNIPLKMMHMKCLPAKVFNDLSRCWSADTTVDLNKHPSLRSDETPIKVIYKQSISLNHSGFLCVSDTQYQNFLKGKRKGGENPACLLFWIYVRGTCSIFEEYGRLMTEKSQLKEGASRKHCVRCLNARERQNIPVLATSCWWVMLLFSWFCIFHGCVRLWSFSRCTESAWQTLLTEQTPKQRTRWHRMLSHYRPFGVLGAHYSFSMTLSNWGRIYFLTAI